MKIVLASQNIHKLKEFSDMARGTSLEFLCPPKNTAFPEETGDSFEANALLKAQFVFSLTGMATLGDDSGLEVDCLGGRPGVHSSRFSCESNDLSNVNKLLKEMKGVKEEERTARFKCVLVFIKDKEAKPVKTEGSLDGSISKKKKGKLGFGYDPVFIPKDFHLHLAELEGHQKNAISHRAKAFQFLMSKLVL